MDAAAAQAAFWEAVIGWIPQIVGALALAVLAFLASVATKLNNASREGVAVVERAKRGGVRMTPVEQKRKAVDVTRNTMGISGSLIPKTLIAARVQDVVDSGNAMLRAKSDPQLQPGESGEHLIVIPRNDPPDIPRPSGEFRGIDFSAIEIADANETGEDQ